MTDRLTWDRLLSSGRPQSRESFSGSLSAPAPAPPETIESRTEFEKDHDRIIFSAPFRRLARKTQVHPLEKNDHVHNRLTHSLEVASVGRSLATKLVGKLQQEQAVTSEQAKDLTAVTQAACLMHDLGNPPFGHAAEEAVRQWARDNHDALFEKPLESGSRPLFQSDEEKLNVIADWQFAEGNANGFRFAARKDIPLISYLNLTHATLASAIKYPWTSSDSKTPRKRKHNVYSTEREIFSALADDLGLKRAEGSVCRHPLSFLTEAADDICYRIIDLEDAVELKIENHDDIRKLLCEIAGIEYRPRTNLQYLRAVSIGTLTEKFWKVFENDVERIMQGEREEDLKSSLDSQTADQLERIKDFYSSIFSHPRKISLEIGCYHILARILSELLKTVRMIHSCDSFEELPFLARRCAELAWTSDYTRANFQKGYAWWLAQMMDFVNGMTDDYAANISSQIAGLGHMNS